MNDTNKSTLHGILSTILREHAYTRANGKVASERTVSSRTEVLKKCFNDLHDLGYRLQNPRNLNEQHIAALCKHWLAEGKAVTTMQEYISKLRLFGEWIGKPTMVKSLWTYLPDVPRDQLKVIKAARRSKSWTENGIDLAEKIALADAIDRRFGLMVRFQYSFGLRRKEVLSTHPWQADQGDKFVVYPGEAKTGRARDIYIYTPEQRTVFDYVKSKVGKGEHLGWQTRLDGGEASYEYNVRRYNRAMRKIGITHDISGVTGHGLRAQYAENAALVVGLLSPTLGGSKDQMDREDLNIRRMWVSELLGHSRLNITDPYYGGFGRRGAVEPTDRRRINIERCLSHLTNDVLDPVPDELISDCATILAQLERMGVRMDLRQACFLWKLHSTRHASSWLSTFDGAATAIEAAALRVEKHMKQREGQQRLI